jgi:penicillin-binding protein 2
VSVLKKVDAEPGNNLILTIDLDLQQKAEQMIESLTSAVVAMEPGTGDILAMASSPSFDQNAFVEGLSHKQWNALRDDPRRPMSNKVIQGEYPPGSTYKIVTAIAALEEGIIDKEFKLNCPGFYEYGDRVFRCWEKRGHGDVNIVKALAESCDVFFYQVGQKLGVDMLARYATKCGLGSRTGAILEHEEEGLIPTIEWKKRRLGVPWQGGETLSIAIGQGYNLVTPLQMLVLTSAVANGGRRPVPLILKSIVTAEGMVIDKSESRSLGKLPTSEKTMKIVKQGLWDAVNKTSGTAWKSVHNNRIKISGKTGTSQVVGRKEGDDPLEAEKRAENFKPHAWFVAYAPSSDPEIAVSVIVEHGEHGASSAGPIAKALIETYMKKIRGGENSPVTISPIKTGSW